MRLKAAKYNVKDSNVFIVLIPYDIFSDEQRVHVAFTQVHALFPNYPCILSALNPEDKKLYFFGVKAVADLAKGFDLKKDMWETYEIEDEAFKGLEFPSMEGIIALNNNFQKAIGLI